jgi:7-cyano-7-deazaguanine reductase
MKKKSTYRGLQENIRKIKLPKIDVWKNKYPDKEYVVKFDAPEFTCICPKTGLPDFAHIFIEYSFFMNMLSTECLKTWQETASLAG